MADLDELAEDSLALGGETLIRSYGLYWSREAVDWKQGELRGERRKYKLTSKNKSSKIKECDVWRQRGIYALYSDFKLVYVGMANSPSEGIGSRLFSHHTKPRMHSRWDSFSWFGIDAYDNDAKIVPYERWPDRRSNGHSNAGIDLDFDSQPNDESVRG